MIGGIKFAYESVNLSFFRYGDMRGHLHAPFFEPAYCPDLRSLLNVNNKNLRLEAPPALCIVCFWYGVFGHTFSFIQFIAKVMDVGIETATKVIKTPILPNIMSCL